MSLYQQETIRNYQNVLVKDLKDQFLNWNEYKTKSENKNATNKYRYFLESNFAGVNKLFVLVYSNQDSSSKRFNAEIYHLPKGIIRNHNVIINGKNFYDQSIDSDINVCYQAIRKLATGQGEDYTARCLLDYDYIKNHYKLITIDSSKRS